LKSSASGGRWLIVRDLLLGPRRCTDLARGLAEITPTRLVRAMAFPFGSKIGAQIEPEALEHGSDPGMSRGRRVTTPSADRVHRSADAIHHTFFHHAAGCIVRTRQRPQTWAEEVQRLHLPTRRHAVSRRIGNRAG
jgi:hypothetical protein